MHLKKIILFTAILGLAGIAFGSQTASKPLTLQDCVSIALNNQQDVRISKNSYRIAQSRVQKATSGYFPQIYVQNNTFNWNISGDSLGQSSGDTTLSVSQTFFDGGFRELSLQNARYSLSQSENSLQRTIQTVTFNVTSAFYDYLRNLYLVDVSETSVKYNESLLERINARIESGDAAIADQYPVLAQLANAKYNLLNSQNNARLALLQLQQEMGISSKNSFQVAETVITPEFEMKSLDEYQKIASINRPDLIRAKTSVSSSDVSVKSSRLSLLPRFSVTGSYDTGLSGSGLQDSSQIVGVISFNLFNGGSNWADYQESLLNKKNTQLEVERISINIQSQVEQAYINLNSAKERMNAAEIGYTAAKKNYEVQQEKYTLQMATTLDVLNAEVQLVTAQTNKVTAEFDLYSAIAQMNYSLGIGGF